jgi:multidrug resistance efflux pump
LISSEDNEDMTLIRLRSHRDELICLENELRDRLKLNKTIITAPFSGIIDNVIVKTGEVVYPGR